MYKFFRLAISCSSTQLTDLSRGKWGWRQSWETIDDAAEQAPAVGARGTLCQYPTKSNNSVTRTVWN
jgi:hypothetical protein